MSLRCSLSFVARRVLLCALLGGPIVPLVAWSDEGSQIGIDNFKFNPAQMTVDKGTEVIWTNHDDIPHSIALPSLAVRSKAMDTDGTFAYRFEKTGTFFYVCGLHPFMQGKVVVK
jgi:plastocyanin